MQVIPNITLYKCDHCGKKQQRRHSMVAHEQFCGSNPENRHACFDCKHLEISTDKIYPDADPESRSITVKTFYCKHSEVDLYSFKAEKMKLLQKYPEDFEGKFRMPLKCLHFKDKYDDAYNIAPFN